MKNYILLVVVFSLFACNVQKNSTKGDKNIEIITKNSYSMKENIDFVIKNKSEANIFILNPLEINIEYFESDKWTKQSILYCPCENSCPNPPQMLEVKKSKSISQKWNQKITWCADRTTKEKQATKGKYRLVIKYRTSELGKIIKTTKKNKIN